MQRGLATGRWDDLPERLGELRKVMGYAPAPMPGCRCEGNSHVAECGVGRALRESRSPAEEIAGLG